ncbi:hypothetical protein Tco_0521753 [Tanacetum coccineum]
MKAICNIDVPIDFQAPKTSSQIEKTEASKSKTVQSDKETQSSLAKDKIPSHPLPSTPVVGEMHKGGTDVMLQQILRLEVPIESNEISKKIKMEDLSDLMQDTRLSFLTPDSPQDELIIVSDESEEEETERYEDTHTTSHDGPKGTSILYPPSPKSAQIQELMAQVAELKNIQWELPLEFLDFPSQVSSVQEKLKTLDSLPSILNKFIDTLNRFATIMKNASGPTGALPAEGEKNTYSTTKEENLKNDLVDLMGIDVVKEYHKKKLLIAVIMKYLMKISKKARILELKRRHLKITVLTTNTPYPSRKIRRICACTSQKTTKETRSIHRIQGRPIRSIQAMEIKYSGRYQTWSLLQETPNTPYRRLSIRRIDLVPDLINRKLKNEF